MFDGIIHARCFMEIDKQLDVITARTVDLVSRDELRRKLEQAKAAGRPLRVKYGADPSAPDIHLGHVVPLNKLREFQDLGHLVVFIIGDFTGMIGDPSGRSETRPPLTREQVLANARTYQEQVFKILDQHRTEVRFNSEWCSPLKFDDILRLTAKMTVARMLAREDFQKRMQANTPVSMVELLYPMTQGYDSVMVDADIEIGGTDQLFNLLVGRDLQKAFGKEPQVVLTLPLLEGLDGNRKMSKSLGNYVGVTEPPGEMYGKLMSIPDELMWRYFELALCRPADEIAAKRRALDAGKLHPRNIKDELAQAVVGKFHGAAAAAAAADEFKRIFTEHQLPKDIPEVTLPSDQFKNNRIWIAALIVAAGLADSNAAARRLVQQGAVRLGNQKITDPSADVEVAPGCILQVGKRGFARLTRQ
jgi:tyrosyl-tRNA synthetase